MGALSPPVLLVLPPGAPGWWALLSHPGSLELQALLLAGGGQVHMSASAVSVVVRFMGSATAGGGGDKGLESWAPQQLEGWSPRPHCHCCPVTCGYGYHCGQGHMHHLPCYYHVLWGCGLSCHGWKAGIAGSCSPDSASLKCSNPPNFRCTGV